MGGKSPRVSHITGLQCVLSGNQVVRIGDAVPVSLKGNHIHGNVYVETGEIQLDLRRKVYCFMAIDFNEKKGQFCPFFVHVIYKHKNYNLLIYFDIISDIILQDLKEVKK